MFYSSSLKSTTDMPHCQLEWVGGASAGCHLRSQVFIVLEGCMNRAIGDLTDWLTPKIHNLNRRISRHQIYKVHHTYSLRNFEQDPLNGPILSFKKVLFKIS